MEPYAGRHRHSITQQCYLMLPDQTSVLIVHRPLDQRLDARIEWTSMRATRGLAIHTVTGTAVSSRKESELDYLRHRGRNM